MEAHEAAEAADRDAAVDAEAADAERQALAELVRDMVRAELAEHGTGRSSSPDGIEDPLLQLAQPFPKAMVGLLPKVTCRDCTNRRCQKHEKRQCQQCGNFITPAHIHIDYVGHGAVTKRLLEVDPAWTWEPAGVDPQGLPIFEYAADSDGVQHPVRFWLKLTVLGVTRLGVGSVDRGAFDAEKQLIGDALRNAAMRFGVALDLWVKGQGEADERASTMAQLDADPEPARAAGPMAGDDLPTADKRRLTAAINALDKASKQALVARWTEVQPDGDPLLPKVGALKWGHLPFAERMIAQAKAGQLLPDPTDEGVAMTPQEAAEEAAQADAGQQPPPADETVPAGAQVAQADAEPDGVPELVPVPESANDIRAWLTPLVEAADPADVRRVEAEVQELHHTKLNTRLREYGFDPMADSRHVDLRRMALTGILLEERTHRRQHAEGAHRTERQDACPDCAAAYDQPT